MIKRLQRRSFLKRAAIATGLTGLSSQVYGTTTGYNGRVLINLQLEGGVDPTCWCDPKENTPGERKISNWADSGSTRSAGNIS